MLNLRNFENEIYKKNIIYFNNDDEFINFCINPLVKINTNEKVPYAYYDFSDNYYNALKANKKFCIKDENSRIVKDGMVGYRTSTLKVDNLEPYYTDDELNNMVYEM